MTWLGKWLQKVAGAWFGPDEPDQPGAMRATLRGSASVTGALTNGSEEVVTLPSGIWLSGAIPAPVKRPKTIKVNISAKLAGRSTVTASIMAAASMQAVINGTATVSATGIAVFNFKEHRRIKDEEAVAAWLMAA